MSKKTTKTIEPKQCVYPECRNTSRTRGLCHGHYQTMRARVRSGAADETDLESRGLLLPKGTGGSPINTVRDDQGYDAFSLGSKVRGG
jgi:hypothetical protein